MLPILFSKMMKIGMRDAGIGNAKLCNLCGSNLLSNNDLNDGFVLCFESTHFQWPNAPWMYLEMVDRARSMLGICRTAPTLDVVIAFADTGFASCHRCFYNYLYEIEDSCLNTSYEPFVHIIRKKHGAKDNKRPDTDVSSSWRHDPVEYPSILSSYEGRDDSDQP